MTRFFSRPRSPARSKLRAARGAGATRRVILLYHRVAAPGHDPFALAVPPAWFRDHLEIVKSRSRLVTLDEILRTDGASDRDGSEVLASITFDDGYADNLAVASPMLRDAAIPATFFVCTGSLGDARGFWWDRLASAIAATDEPAASLDGLPGLEDIPFEGEPTSEDARVRATLAIAARLQPMHPEPRDRLVEELEARLPVRHGARREDSPIMDEAELRDL